MSLDEKVHQCKVIEEKDIRDVTVETYDGEWLIKDHFEDTGIMPIFYCPYCGEKLEPHK